MDSLTQIALGAAVSVAVMRHRTAAWKAAAWGAVAGTLPDLDVFIDHGDPILNMVLHRAQTHAPFWLALFAVPMGLLVAGLQRQLHLWRWWCLAMALALVTHPLLDALTIYGTQLALPWSNYPYGAGSVFIIDPLVTLPWLAGTAVALWLRGSSAGLRANSIGLSIGVAYLLGALMLQQLAAWRVHESLAARGGPYQRMMVTPAPLNAVLWRTVVMTPQHYLEGFHSVLFDGPGPVTLDAFDRGTALDAQLDGIDGVRRIRTFSKGFYKVHECGPYICITDLRMGQEPHYVFSFAVARRGADGRIEPLAKPLSVGTRGDPGALLAWLWPRILGQPLAPPRQ